MGPLTTFGVFDCSLQVLVARLLHSLYSEHTATHFAILSTAREHLLAGGPRRVRHTLPALGFCALQLVGPSILVC